MTVYPLVKVAPGWYLRSVAPVRTSPAVILRWRAYGESDKIVTFLTRDFGKLTGIAKGAMRSRRRFVNSLEPLARVRARFRRRAGSSLAFLESCDLLRPAGRLTDPLRFAYGAYLVELTERLTAEEQAVPEIYGLLEEGLSALEERPACGALLRAFELRLLAGAGYEPELRKCRSCAAPLPKEGRLLLDLHAGTLLCPRCAAVERPPSTEEFEVPVLRRLDELRQRPLATCEPQLLEGVASRAAAFTGRLLALHLTRPLKSPRAIAQATAVRSRATAPAAGTPPNGRAHGC